MKKNRRTMCHPSLVFLATALFGSASIECVAQEEIEIHFGRDIRPLLSDRCFLCHGPDRAMQKADLRLDSFEGATTDRDGQFAIVPGDPEASLLYQRIASENPRKLMPPPKSGKHALAPEEIERIRVWIESGAAYEEHWAFDPLSQPEVPDVEDVGWCHNAIDRFVLARMESASLSPSPEAEKATLARRLFIDVTGLPPTLDELDAYMADDSADAYEGLIEKLLTTEPYRTRYAERMATPWLDLARYADTSGIHMDAGRSIWPWRDWVLEAYRDNMPFDQFVIEQISGDQLPNPTTQQIIASGFNRNHVTSDEGGAINDEYLLEYAVDRTNTVGTVFLGLSVGCARCHDHKFDPVSTEEFYSLLAFFNNNEEPGVYSQIQDPYRALEPAFELRREEDRARITELETLLASLKTKRDTPSPDEAEQISAFINGLRTDGEWEWHQATIDSAMSKGGATMTVQTDGSVLATGVNPASDEYTLSLSTDETDLRTVLLEIMPDPSLHQNRVGRPENGNAIVSGISAEVISKTDPAIRRPIKFTWAWADLEQNDGGTDFRATNILRPDDGRVWALGAHQVAGGRAALLTTNQPFGYEGGSTIELKIDCNSVYAQHAIGRMKILLGSANDDALARLPVSQSNWYIVGPFPAGSGEEAYATAYGPEEDGPLDFTKTFGTQSWRHAPGVIDGQNVNLAQGMGAEYVAREIHAPTARPLTLSMGSDDGIQIYRNGEQVFQRKINRGIAPDQDTVEIDLVKGRNTLVCKIVNTGGPGAIYYRRIPLETDIPNRLVSTLVPESSLRPVVLDAASAGWRARFSTEYQVASGEIKAVEQSLARVTTDVPKTMVMKERAQMRPTYVYTRGLYSQPDKNRPVSRAVPAALGILPTEETPSRVDLAEWLVGDENPLTARVTVNRFWEILFGRGLVETSDDFGLQGSWPTHPELLDWMASEFRDGGWDVQDMMRRILTSATYQQSSATRTDVIASDPGNKLLTSYPRQRLSAEQLRDQALYVSGLLTEELGGPSVKPYQPEGLWREVAMPQSNTRSFARGDGNDLWRRSLYTYWKRAAPPPSMVAFDAPTREYCATRRITTNTPLQALVLWNDEQFVEAARATAVRVLSNRKSERDNILQLYRICTGDVPSPSMARMMLKTLRAYRNRYVESNEDATRLLAVGESRFPSDIPVSEIAAWTMLANAILSSEAAIVKD